MCYHYTIPDWLGGQDSNPCATVTLPPTGAGRGNRTPVFWLEARGSSTELAADPLLFREMLCHLSYSGWCSGVDSNHRSLGYQPSAFVTKLPLQKRKIPIQAQGCEVWCKILTCRAHPCQKSGTGRGFYHRFGGMSNPKRKRDAPLDGTSLVFLRRDLRKAYKSRVISP